MTCGISPAKRPSLKRVHPLVREIEKIRKSNFDGLLLKPISYIDLITEVQKFIKAKKISKKDLRDPKSSEFQVSEEIKQKLPELIRIIEKEWMADWEKLQKKQAMDEVESFGIKIQNGGKEFQIEPSRNERSG